MELAGHLLVYGSRLFLSFRLKTETDGVNAIPFAARVLRAVIEYMAQVASAVLAEDFVPVAVLIYTYADILGDGWVRE